MSELLTAGQMRALELGCIESGRVSGAELMERAGRGCVSAILEHWPEVQTRPAKAVVLCGPGNNGGDGFVIARLLAGLEWSVRCFLVGTAADLPEDARANFAAWGELGAVEEMDVEAVVAACDSGTVVIDALFGAGLSRPVQGIAADVLCRLGGWRKAPPPRMGVMAVDGPSGLCLNSGRILQSRAGTAGAYLLPADLTVTFERRKLGHVLGDGAEVCGHVHVAPIGLDDAVQDLRFDNSVVREVQAPVVSDTPAGAAVNLQKGVQRHKFHHGHVVVVSGPAGQGGAARLAARAALRIGAGLVTLAVPAAAMTETAARVDAVMLRQVDSAADLNDLLDDPRVSAVCIGPGLGLGDGAADLLRCVLERGKATVLDADAITLVARRKELRAALHSRCVLTPHEGEFARLCPDLAKDLGALASSGPAMSKVDAARKAASALGASIVYKGVETVIAAPARSCAVHIARADRAAPWLATAGSGDVLAGLIAGLLGRHENSFFAEQAAVWLHVSCGRAFGPGLIAEDLPEMLPQVMRDLQAETLT